MAPPFPPTARSAPQPLPTEDDDDIRQGLVEILQDEGYEVVAVPNGLEAHDRLRSAVELPDLILLDLMMPVMDGWQFRAEQLKEPALARIPVVVMSAIGDVDKEARTLGIADYVTKPVKVEVVLGTVRRLCAA